MKTLSGTVGFVVLAVIAIVAALAFRAFATATPTPTPTLEKYKVHLEFGKRGTATTPTEYIDLGDNMKDDFDKALCKLKRKGGEFEVGFKEHATASPTPIGEYNPICRTESINTDKVTTSELAKNAPAGESAAYDPNVVYRVSANSTKDVKDVLATFKED